MAVRIRLQRHGKKGSPFYYIVAADARSKRDGRYIERIGSYNPNTNPATIDLDLDRAVDWLGNGAETSDTAKAILQYKGAMHRHHLNRGVAKGALTEEQATQKFEAWMAEKEAKINAGKSAIQKKLDDERNTRLAKEKEIKEARAAALAAAASPIVADVVTEEAPAADESTEASAEVEAAEETPAADESTEASAEVEAAEEAPAEDESTEASAEVEAAEEAPAEEGDDAEEKKED